jgi:hypothetical protein
MSARRKVQSSVAISKMHIKSRWLFHWNNCLSHLFSVPEKRCSLGLFAQSRVSDRGEWKKGNNSSSWAHSHSRKATWHEMSHSHTSSAGADRGAVRSPQLSLVNWIKSPAAPAMDDGARRALAPYFIIIHVFTSLYWPAAVWRQHLASYQSKVNLLPIHKHSICRKIKNFLTTRSEAKYFIMNSVHLRRRLTQFRGICHWGKKWNFW